MTNNLQALAALVTVQGFSGGGIVAFQANLDDNPLDDILTWGIQGVEHGKVTHTAIVPALTQFVYAQPDLHICESTILQNNLTGKTVNGPQMNSLRLRLMIYNGRAWYAPFRAEVTDLNWLQAYGSIGQKFGKDHYSVANLFLDLGHAIGLPVHAKIVNSEVCSEYCFEWLKAAGLANCPDPAGTTPEILLNQPIYRNAVQLIGDPAPLR